MLLLEIKTVVHWRASGMCDPHCYNYPIVEHHCSSIYIIVSEYESLKVRSMLTQNLYSIPYMIRHTTCNNMETHLPMMLTH